MAVFDPVEIDGCQVSRASLHNLSFIEGLELVPGNRIMVSKRNQIIPHIEENLDRGKFALDAVVPRQCPCCGQPDGYKRQSLRRWNQEIIRITPPSKQKLHFLSMPLHF